MSKPLNVIVLSFDGGCKPTNPGNKYGSFEVKLDQKIVSTVCNIDLGWGTSNEAEFETLLAGLKWILEKLEVGGFPSKSYWITIWSDSTIVVNRISGRNKTNKDEPQKRMFDLNAKCLDLLSKFQGYNIQWHNRLANVQKFGH